MVEKILIIGATGYIGKFIATASLALGHPTFLLVRSSSGEDKAKAALLESFKASGATILLGDLDDYGSLLSAVKQVTVVISTLHGSQVPRQTNIIKAIQEAGCIKRFLPSEFGMDHGAVRNIHPVLHNAFTAKVEIRKAVQDAGVPYTLLCSNGFAEYILNSLGLLASPRDKINIWGTGNVKLALTDENDIGTYTIKAAVDPRTLNKTVQIIPPANLLSLNELVPLWEKKIGKTLEKTYISEAEVLKLIEGTPFPQKFMIALFYQVFTQEPSYDTEHEATKLFPDVAYTKLDAFLNRFV